MASIHKDPRGKSPYWYCYFTNPDGSRSCKSTKLKDRSAALEFCMGLERASKLGMSGNLTEIRAKALISEIVERAGGEALDFRSLKEFSHDWLENKKTRNSDGTVVRYKGFLDNFMTHLGEKKSKQSIASVIPKDVQGFINAEVKAGKSATTADLALKTLRGLFNAARRQGLITHNPAEAVEAFNAEKQERDCFTSAQVKKLIKVAKAEKPEWVTMILLGYYTGARLGDCATMRWSNVDFVTKTLRYAPKKGGKGKVLILPMMTELETHLLSLPSSDKSDDFLCPNLANKGTGGNRGLSESFNRIVRKTDIIVETGEATKGKGRRFKKLGFHSLRHTNVSELANSGVAPEIRQSITGHKDERVHARYTHIETTKKRKALEKLPSVSGD
jgi:integrase/recombinase XerC